MFHFRAPIGRQHLGARTSRRAHKHRKATRSRRFVLEALEARQMLCATHLAPGLTAFPAASHAADDDPLPPGFTIAQTALQNHWAHTGVSDLVGDPTPADGLGAEGTSTSATSSLHPLTDLPLLHSNPSATVKLYLDFDGHFEPVWGSYNNVTTPVFDRDGDPTTYNDDELNLMYVAWSNVSEDFAPFNVDVTTEEPPELALGVPESVANGVALRIAIGGHWQDWLGSPAGGVAYIDNFTNSIANVVYVFTDSKTLSQHGEFIGNVASHEAGHGFGLQHQSSFDQLGNKINEYNSPAGDWAPIMGGSYYPHETWYNGTSTFGPTEFQDDMAVIARPANGFGFRADDHGNTLATATPLGTDGATWSANGIIEQNDDVDVFSFTVAVQNDFRMAANVAAIGPNLDAVLQLRDAAGQLLTMANPFDAQPAEIVSNLVPGGYSLSVLSSGVYGWIGQYTVTIDTSDAAIFVTPTSYPLITSETGATSSFTVVLSTAPTADVTIPVSSSNLGEGAASASSLVFTPANWNIPQTVTVTGVDDHVPDGDTAYSIVLGLASSADPRFNVLNVVDVSVANIDNEVKFVTVDDAAADRAYSYAADGMSRSTSSLGTFNTAPRGVASSITGDKTWVIDANRTVYVYSAGGALLGSWSAGSLANNATPEGIASDGTDVWIVDSRSDKVYRFASAASRLAGSQSATSSFSLYSNKFNQAASNNNPKDIVADGQSVWVVDDATTDKVFKYSLAGTLLGSWAIDSQNQSPTGIAVDPTNRGNLWITDSGTDRVYQYNNAAFRTAGSQAAAITFSLTPGNGNPQGIAVVPVSDTGGVSEADLAVTSSAPSTSTEGNLVTFSLTVTNNGPAVATDVVLTDTLGATWVYASASTTQGTISQSGRLVTFAIGAVAPGQTVTAQVSARTLEPGTLINSASVTSSGSDSNLSNNTAVRTVSSAAAPIVVSGSPLTLSGKKQNNITTATFTHASGVHPASYYTATINWGDGTTSAGSISQSGSNYTVKGSHTYPNGAAYTVTTTIARASGASGSAVAQAAALDEAFFALASAPITATSSQRVSFIPDARPAVPLPAGLQPSSLDVLNLVVPTADLARQRAFDLLDQLQSYTPGKRPLWTGDVSAQHDEWNITDTHGHDGAVAALAL